VRLEGSLVTIKSDYSFVSLSFFSEEISYTVVVSGLKFQRLSLPSSSGFDDINVVFASYI
jgi:hypothetical protein